MRRARIVNERRTGRGGKVAPPHDSRWPWMATAPQLFDDNPTPHPPHGGGGGGEGRKEAGSVDGPSWWPADYRGRAWSFSRDMARGMADEIATRSRSTSWARSGFAVSSICATSIYRTADNLVLMTSLGVVDQGAAHVSIHRARGAGTEKRCSPPSTDFPNVDSGARQEALAHVGELWPHLRAALIASLVTACGVLVLAGAITAGTGRAFRCGGAEGLRRDAGATRWSI